MPYMIAVSLEMSDEPKICDMHIHRNKKNTEPKPCTTKVYHFIRFIKKKYELQKKHSMPPNLVFFYYFYRLIR